MPGCSAHFRNFMVRSMFRKQRIRVAVCPQAIVVVEGGLPLPAGKTSAKGWSGGIGHSFVVVEKRGRSMENGHIMTYRVSYADTDRMNRVYYANYLEICERARTELLRAVGLPYREIEAKGRFFPVRRCEIRYFGFAVYDELLVCRTRVSRLRHATLAFTTDILRDGQEKPLVTAMVELACLSEAGKPAPLPDELCLALRPYLEASVEK